MERIEQEELEAILAQGLEDIGPRVGNVRKWQSDVFFKSKKGTYTGKSLDQV